MDIDESDKEHQPPLEVDNIVIEVDNIEIELG